MRHPSHDWILTLHPNGPLTRAPACSASTVVTAMERLGPGPVGWAVELSRAMTEKIIDRVPEHGGSSAAFDTLCRAVEATVLLAIVALHANARPAEGAIAHEAVEGAVELARRGLTLDQVLRGVRIGHACLQRELLRAIGHLPEEQRVAETDRVTDALFAYADLQEVGLAEEYNAERERWHGQTESARRRMVEGILAGEATDPDAAVRVLGYDLRHHHIAFIVWANSPDSPPGQLRRFATALAKEAGCDWHVTVPSGPRRLWTWAGWPVCPTTPLVGSEVTRPPLPPDISVAVGPPAHGPSGFRRSHLGAAEAERIARLTGRRGWCDYAEVRVASLCTADAEHGNWFVAETLGALGSADERTAELRETLRVYLAEGRSPQRAARRLHVSRNTVTYRVRQAEEILGRPLGPGLEMWLALEAARVPRSFDGG
jgi:hypothetical protein